MIWRPRGRRRIRRGKNGGGEECMGCGAGSRRERVSDGGQCGGVQGDPPGAVQAERPEDVEYHRSPTMDWRTLCNWQIQEAPKIQEAPQIEEAPQIQESSFKIKKVKKIQETPQIQEKIINIINN